MVDPAEHDVRHHSQLFFDGLANVRMVVAMTRRPPRSHSVDEFSPVCKRQIHAFRRDDGEWQRSRLHLRVRHPDVPVSRVLPIGC